MVPIVPTTGRQRVKIQPKTLGTAKSMNWGLEVGGKIYNIYTLLLKQNLDSVEKGPSKGCLGTRILRIFAK